MRVGLKSDKIQKCPSKTYSLWYGMENKNQHRSHEISYQRPGHGINNPPYVRYTRDEELHVANMPP